MIALGALGIIGGGVCLAWGLPYLVLEQGFTYAIIGSVLMTGGVLLIALGLLLRELRAMAGRIGGFSAQDAAAAIAAGAVAAGSAVAAGIVAGQTQPDEAKSIDKDDAQGELPLDAAQEHGSAPEPEPAPAEAALAEAPATVPDTMGPDDAVPSLETASHSEIQVPPATVPPALKLPTVAAWPQAASWSNLDELPAPRRDIEEQDGKEPAMEDHASSPVAPVAPMPPAPTDDEDPFERLRRSLILGEKPVRADALAAGMTPGAREEDPAFPGLPHREASLPTAALRDESVRDDAIMDVSVPEPEDHAEAVIAEAAAVIAQDIEGDAEGEPKRDEADVPEPEAAISEAEAPDIEGPGAQEHAAEESGADKSGAEASSTPEGPAISQEGIVSVRRIGDSTYTMYADGSVKAETPDAVLHFATVGELKAHLANPMR
jgi:hypothetical protein